MYTLPFIRPIPFPYCQLFVQDDQYALRTNLFDIMFCIGFLLVRLYAYETVKCLLIQTNDVLLCTNMLEGMLIFFL